VLLRAFIGAGECADEWGRDDDDDDDDDDDEEEEEEEEEEPLDGPRSGSDMTSSDTPTSAMS
jgi:hypothetical protein